MRHIEREGFVLCALFGIRRLRRNALIGFAFYTAKRLRPKAQVCFNPGRARIGNPTPTGLRPGVTLHEIQISADATAFAVEIRQGV